jgi:hypothetical protein
LRDLKKITAHLNFPAEIAKPSPSNGVEQVERITNVVTRDWGQNHVGASHRENCCVFSHCLRLRALSVFGLLVVARTPARGGGTVCEGTRNMV